MAVIPVSTDQRGDWAAQQGTSDSANYHEIFDVISFSDVLEDVIRWDQNFLGLWSKGPEIAALEHRWQYQVQMPSTLTVTSCNLQVGSGDHIDIPNAQAARLPDNTAIAAGITAYLIDPEVPGETMKVASVGAADSGTGGAGFTLVHVVREVTGSDLDHAASGTFQIMDIPYPEGSAPVMQRLNEPSWMHTTCQMFERYIELTRHQIKAKVNYTSDYFAMQVEQNTKDVLDELAYALMHATWSGTAGAFSLGTKTNPRRTRGLIPTLKATTDADGLTVTPNVDNTAYVFDMDVVELASRMVDDAKGRLGNGSGHGVLMLDVEMYDAAMELWGDKVVQISKDETTIGRKVKAIETKRDHVLEIRKDRRWPKGHVAILNPPDMQYRPFVGSDWVAEQYAKTRDSENWRLYGDYFAVIEHAQQNFALLTNVSAE